MKFRALVTLASVYLAACAIEVGYFTVVLPESFEANANRIEVKAPTSRYKDSFYDVSLGQHKINNTRIDDTKKLRLSNNPEEQISEDYTLWNLLLTGKIQFERATYNQHRYEQTQEFGFSMNSSDDVRVVSECKRTDIGFDNEETGRYSLSLKETDERYTQSYGEWLASELTCFFQQERNNWSMKSILSAENSPALELIGSTKAYTFKVLESSMTDRPGQGGRATHSLDHDVASYSFIPGVGVFLEDQQIAAASFNEGNNWIWIARNLSKDEHAMIVSTLHALILNTWITGQG